jgi:hypothetical protein
MKNLNFGSFASLKEGHCSVGVPRKINEMDEFAPTNTLKISLSKTKLMRNR